jgi:ubiquinone/menaquinone biosynthesis C-methylase UbiE
MLREAAHFLLHAPGTLWLKAKLPQAELYDELMDRAEVRGLGAARARMAASVGDGARVLELGCGTGMLFGHYRPGTEVVAVDLDEAFLERAKARAAASSAKITLQRADATELPFPDRSFDEVLIFLVLCSIPNPSRALAEVRRVLRPGGTLRAFEHVISERPAAATLMRALDPLWLAANGQGCHLDRDTTKDIERAGFALESVEKSQLWSPGLPAFPMREITAR